MIIRSVPVRWGTFPLVLAITTSGFLLTRGEPVGASPAAAAAAASCPTMQVVGVRGSGETADDAGGYGQTVQAVVEAVRDQVPAVAATAIDYPAIPVQLYKPTYYTGNYTNSVRQGALNLRDFVNGFIAGPCGRTTYLYLVGFSQGAQVAGDVYQGVPAATRARIAGVALIGDPKFKGSQAEIDEGDYSSRLNGIQDVIGSSRMLPKDQYPPVRSYCTSGDPVCNFSARNAAVCLSVGALCPHVNYRSLSSPGPYRPYTRAAADFLVSRWKIVGPPAPKVGQRSNVLIFDGYGNGAANLQTALAGAGYTVTFSPELPADLSPYGQVWWYGIDPLSLAQEDQLVAYGRAGGSLYLTGEWQACGCNNANVRHVFDRLVLTVGGLQFGPDLSSGQDVSYVNRQAIHGAASLPRTLTTLTTNAIGTISSTNIGLEHFLFTDLAGHGTVGLWDNTDVFGGGRLAIVMDVNWADDQFSDPGTRSQNAVNLAFFLSGATTGPTLAAAHAATPVPPVRRAGKTVR